MEWYLNQKMRLTMLNQHIATSVSLNHKFATNMTPTIISSIYYIFFFFEGEMVIPFVDDSNVKWTILEQKFGIQKTKTNNNHLNQRLIKCLRIFSGTTEIYLTNELPIPTSLLKSDYRDRSQSL